MMLCINVCKAPFFLRTRTWLAPFFPSDPSQKALCQKMVQDRLPSRSPIKLSFPLIMLLVLMLPSALFDLRLLVFSASTVFLIASPSYSCLQSSRSSDSVNWVLAFFIPTTLRFIYFSKWRRCRLLASCIVHSNHFKLSVTILYVRKMRTDRWRG